MKLLIKLSVAFIHLSTMAMGQEYSGSVINKDSSSIAFVNIGIPMKSIGTVSDINGDFSINLKEQPNNDSLMFSCIGFKPYTIAIKDFKALNNKVIVLQKETYAIEGVTALGKHLKDKTFGIENKSNLISGGFSEVELGYEFGILIKNKNRAFLKTMYINIATCDFDSVFFRVNLYSVKGKDNYSNILKEPIYINISKNDIDNKIIIDLRPYKLCVTDDFLVTLEHVKDLGKGSLYFYGSLLKKTYIRKTSQDKWSKVPLGAGIYIDAKVEV